MALPVNRIKKIKLPDNSEYEIIPEKISDRSGNYAILPSLSNDSVIVTTDVDQTITGNKYFTGSTEFDNDVDILDGNTLCIGCSDVEFNYNLLTQNDITLHVYNSDLDYDPIYNNDLGLKFNNGKFGFSVSYSNGAQKWITIPNKSGEIALIDDTKIEIVDLTSL